MAKYKIIGVHGLANKPIETTLEKYWRQSITEGLKKNNPIDIPSNELSFDLVYWADVMYPQPLTNNPEPYTPAANGSLKFYADGIWDEILAAGLDVFGDALDFSKRYFGWGTIANAVLKAKLEDLSRYYQERQIREKLRERLRKALQLAHENGEKIILVAHSMGTIIAYDELRALGNQNAAFTVDLFITIGSPLGLPHVCHQIRKEWKTVRTPSVVRSWYNFADRRDTVALDIHLSDDYGANSSGIRPIDKFVCNDYAGERNSHHKSYGYLRTPEFSNCLSIFI